MKKLLLMSVFAVAGTMAAQAYEVGDYIYTELDKYKVTGPNVVTNGDFSDQYAGWQNEKFEEVNSAYWTLQMGVGPNGESAVESASSESGEGNALARVWSDLEPGLYVVSYMIKGTDAGNTSVTADAQNYVDIFVNNDGALVYAEGMRRVAEVSAFGTEWTAVSDTVTISAGEQLVFNASRLIQGTQLTGFEIHTAMPVYDTRVYDRIMTYYKWLVNQTSYFTAESIELFVEEIEDADDQMSQGTNAENASFVAPLLTNLEERYAEFLAANGVTTESVIGDWTKQGYSNWNRITQIGSYALQGGRWGFSPNDESLERPADDGFVATAGIQTSFDLAVSMHLEDAALPTGKYLFVIEAQAVAAANKAAPYGADFSKAIVGPSIYAGNDTTFLENDTLSGRYWKKYYHVFEVAPGETVKTGFIFPAYTDKRGGRYSLRNPMLLAIGKTMDEVNFQKNVNNIIAKRVSVKGRIDLAYKNDALTTADGYPWAHQQLKDSLAIYEPVYNASFDIIAADSTVLQPEGVTSELLANLTTADTRLASANNYFNNHNAPFQQLVAALASANESLNHPDHASGDKATFQAVIDEAQSMVDNVNPDVDEGTAFADMTARLQAAQTAFEAGCATYEAPGTVILANPYFTNNGNNPPAEGASAPGNGAGLKDWTFVNNGNWDKHKYTSFVDYGINSFGYAVWRGNSVSPRVKVSQTVSVTQAGVYELKAYAYGERTNNNTLNIGNDPSLVELTDAEGNVNDSIFNPHFFAVFMGENGAPDSTFVHSRYFEADNTFYHPSRYAAIYVKTNNEPVQIEVGLENTGADGVGFNVYGAGDFQLTFGGADVAKYVAASKNALNGELAKAKALAESAGGNEAAAWLVVKLNRCIAAAEAALTVADGDQQLLHATENALLDLQEAQARVEIVVAGINGVAADMVRLNKGVYNLNGVRVASDKAELQSLKKGLYIFNGRKYVVK